MRGDVQTVQAHLDDIAENAPATIPSYVAMAKATADRAVLDGRLLPIRAAKLVRLLDEALVRVGETPAQTAARPSDRRSESAMTTAPLLAHSREELSRCPDATAVVGAASPVALVPTMGALHAGHASLMERARQEVGPRRPVVASIFVNPMQFAPGEDLDRYPRTLRRRPRDLRRAGRRHRLRAVGRGGLPGRRPAGDASTPARSAAVLEGKSRPSHFHGVLTVVAKLFGLVRPDVAVFGEKDYQQLVPDPADGRRPVHGRRRRGRRDGA